MQIHGCPQNRFEAEGDAEVGRQTWRLFEVVHLAFEFEVFETLPGAGSSTTVLCSCRFRFPDR